MSRLHSRVAAAVAAAALLGTVVLSASPTAHASSRQAPVAPAGNAQLGGVVTTGEKREPVRRAVVRISAPTLRGSREITTDDLGRFLFTGLPAGRYTLTARKVGFVEATYGATRHRGIGTAISLADGQKHIDVQFPMLRGAVISGIVTNPSGQPAADMLVVALERTMNGDQLTLTSTGTALTDDRGAYRFFDLPAGTYVLGVANIGAAVAASVTSAAELQWAARQASAGAAGQPGQSPPPASSMMALTQTFYPGTRDASAAAPLTLDAGAERMDISFSLRFVPVARVAGTMVLPDGQPASSGALTLDPIVQPAVTGILGGTRNRATVNARGEFEFLAVEPGRFMLIAQGSGPPPAGQPPAQAARPGLWAREALVVDGRDLDGVVVRLQPTMTLTGRVVTEPGSKPIDFATGLVTISLTPKAGAGSPGLGGTATSVSPAGTFTYQTLTPWSYAIRANLRPATPGPGAVSEWMVSSVTLGGRDVSDRFFDLTSGGPVDDLVITLTNKPASLSGKLVDDAGAPAPEYFVVLVPVDRAYWVAGMSRTPRAVRPANDGTFRFDSVPPGEYFVAATTDFDPRDAANASVLEPLIERAVKVTVKAAEAAVQNLKIGR